MSERKGDAIVSRDGCSDVGTDTSRWTTLLLGDRDSQAPALPMPRKANSKPLQKDHPRFSTGTASAGSLRVCDVSSNKRKKRSGDSIAVGTASSAGRNNWVRLRKGGNGNSMVVETPSNGHTEHRSSGGGRSSSGGKNEYKANKPRRSEDSEANGVASRTPNFFPPKRRTILDSRPPIDTLGKTGTNSVGPLGGAGGGGGKTGLKRKRATNGLADRDAKVSLNGITRDAGLNQKRATNGLADLDAKVSLNGITRDTSVADRDCRRESSPPKDVPGKKRSRPNTLNLAHQAQKAAAEERKVDGRRGVPAKASAERDIPAAEKAQYVGLDCEMVGVGPSGSRSALARCCLVDWDGDVIYDKYVIPGERVTDYRTFVSGVRAKDLKRGIRFRECQKEVAEILKNKYLVGHALLNDLKALAMTHPPHMTRDTATYRPFKKSHGIAGGKLQPTSLKKLALEHLGLTIQEGQHHPAEDARTAMELYKLARREWEKSLAFSGKKRGRRAVVDQQARH